MKNLKAKLAQLENLRDELNLKNIQNYRKGRSNGKDMHYITVCKKKKRGEIFGTEIDGTIYIADVDSE